jgi:uncharacterized membrane protein
VQQSSRQIRKFRKTLHRLFEVGILIKGIDGGLELLGGLLLLVLSPGTISGIVFFFVQAELKEDPTDLIVNLLLHTTRNVLQNKVLASVFLLVHGVAKLLLVAGLLANKRWSYPVAIVVFAAFTVYQTYQLSYQYSLLLVTLTILDVVVILLVIGEYRYARTARSV